ncbi:MAG TPA: HemK/PrmC family methyltransferase, partial [Bacillota bacterium]|nr:HemK/PrmC family methyltransferase [Bacillota bacterium]HPZ84730.1 HemK/PrmC family methyltransferase [Bacillota bacterium]
DDTPHHMLDDTPAAPGDTPRVPSPRPLTVADVCCGSGAIGLSILKHLPEVFAKAGVKPSPDGRAPCHEHITVGVGVQPGLGGPPRRHEGTAIPPVRLVLTDISPDALDVARQNAERLGLLGQVEFLLGDGLEPLRQQGLRGKIDLIASNPPYIPTGVISSLDEEVRCYEPHLALDGGNDGMDFVESLISQAPSLLAPGGYLIMEIGHDQADKCRRLLAEAQHKAMISRRSGSSGSEDEDTVEPLLWKDWRFIKDYAGIERILVARAAGSCS